MRKKTIILFLISFISLSVFAQSEDKGILFFKGSYNEAVEKAIKEKKSIFIDFYTEWCGPCLNMAESVFVLPEVGRLYNDKFVCLKIDAEKGEGVELARQFKINSFPTYIYISPDKPNDILHRSGGNKDAKFFILDAQFAITPKHNSTYMDKCYQTGKYDDNFLKSYVLQKRAMGNTDLSMELFDKLISRGNKLTDPQIWKLYVDCIEGYDNVYTKEVIAKYPKFVEQFGRKAVDAKLFKATYHVPNSELKAICDFEGKDQNMQMNNLSDAVRSENYDEAASIIEDLLNDPKQAKEPLYERLTFYVRIIPGRKVQNLPWEWRVKQVEFLRYMAYNCDNKQVPSYHFYYALGLEFLIGYSQELGKPFPAYLTAQPEKGKKQYDLLNGTLKPKNKK